MHRLVPQRSGVVGVATVLILACAPAAVAHEPPGAEHTPGAHGRSASTFEGSCQFAGTLRQDPPLTTVPQEGQGFARAKGPCSGTFTDERGRIRVLDGDRVTYVAHAEGTLSCGGGSAEGEGYLEYRGEKLRFRFSEVRGPGSGIIRLDGEQGGSAAGEARASEDEDPTEIAEKCANEGLRRVGIRIDLATTPAISG